MEEYARLITEEYNKWAEQYEKAHADGFAEPALSIAAFMCNAITMAVLKSSHREVRDYFNTHAK